MPLRFAADGGRIGHLDFERVNDPRVLEQMLVNAIINRDWHRVERHPSQASAFDKCIKDCLEHAKLLLGEGYEASNFPKYA